MDEHSFRKTLSDVRDRPCVFQRAILQRRCVCGHSERLFLAEREIIACASIEGFNRCGAFMHILKHKTAFVLRLEDPDTPIPYAKAIRLQVGAINGLYGLLYQNEAAACPDVSQVLDGSVERFGELEDIPYERLFDSIRNTPRRPPNEERD